MSAMALPAANYRVNQESDVALQMVRSAVKVERWSDKFRCQGELHIPLSRGRGGKTQSIGRWAC